jgi:hypothetical protein
MPDTDQITIRPIQTRYAGCHFRSRLEARWAVFFDHLGIRWDYEPEGFETSAGPYLPDFRIKLDNGSFLFEVKPEGAPDDPRHRALAQDYSLPQLIIAKGIPRGSTLQRGYFWTFSCPCPGDRHQADVHSAGQQIALYGFRRSSPWGATIDEPVRLDAKVDEAYTAARSARFGR